MALTYSQLVACEITGWLAGADTRAQCERAALAGVDPWLVMRDAAHDTTSAIGKGVSATVGDLGAAAVDTAQAVPDATKAALAAAAAVAAAVAAFLYLPRR